MDNRAWLEERFLRPVVVVIPSVTTEALCQKNGMDFYQLIKPFQVATQQISANTGKDLSHQHVIQNFGVRFSRPDGVVEMSPALRMEHFGAILRKHSKAELANGAMLDSALEKICSSPDLQYPNRIDPSTGRLLVERTYVHWHDSFIRDYTNVVRCSYFDTMDHPSGFLFAVSTTGGFDAVMREINVVSQNIERFRSNVVERIPAMDADMHRFFLIVHDVQSGMPFDELQTLFMKVQKALGGHNCTLLKINSNTSEATAVSAEPWLVANQLVDCYNTVDKPDAGGGRIYNLPDASSGHVARALTSTDVNEIQNAINRYLQTGLVPWIASKLLWLMDQVEKKKTTTFSKVASWFKSDAEKDKAKNEPTFINFGSSKRYLSTAVEMQMRRTGDLFLALRDFENSLKYTRMARDELKSTLIERPFNRHLIAAAQEATALCYFFQGRLPLPGGQKEQDCRLEEARSLYVAANVNSYAFRSSLMLIAMCRNRQVPENGRALGVALTALRFLQSNRLYVAVLNEIAANCTLLSNPPMAGNNVDMAVSVPQDFIAMCNPRKYVRYLIMAGAAYMDVHHDEGALKCYERALLVVAKLGGSTWSAMLEHILDQLSRIHHKLENGLPKRLANLCLVASLGTPRFINPQTAQLSVDTFYGELKSYLEAKDMDRVPHMIVPQIRLKASGAVTVDVYGEDSTTRSEEMFIGSEILETEWRAMEDKIRSHITSVRSPVSLPQRRKPDSNPSKRPVSSAVVNEAVQVQLDVSNNLGVPLPVEGLALIYRPHKTEGSKEEDLIAASNETRTGVPLPEFDLPPLSSAPVQLQVVFPEEGTFDVIGAQWTSYGVKCSYHFALESDLPALEADPYTSSANGKDRNTHIRETLSLLESQFESKESEVAARILRPSPKNVQFAVDPPAAAVRAQLVPPLPSACWDGFVYRGVLRLTNHAKDAAASDISITRSTNNAHFTFFPTWTAEKNDDFEATLALDSSISIPPGESHDVPLVFRAQHSRCRSNPAPGGVFNHLPLLVGFNTAGSTAASVRLHKFVRRVMVRRSLEINAVTLPPTMSTPESASFTTVLEMKNKAAKQDAPMQLARVIACGNRWSLKPMATETLNADEGFLTSEQSFALSISATVDATAPFEPRDSVCLSPSDTIKDPSASEALQAALGDTLANDPATSFFTKHALLAGPGRIGIELDDGEWAFFEDGAGGKKGDETNPSSPTSPDGKLLEPQYPQYPPILVGAVWMAHESGVASFGHVFTLVDVFGSTQRLRGLTDCRPKSMAEQRAGQINPEATLAAFLANESSAANKRAVVHIAPSLPPRVEFPRNIPKPGVPPRPLLLDFEVVATCLSPVPITLDLTAKPPSNSAFSPVQPFFFVGRTRARAVLNPSETITIPFRVALYGPGMYDLNCFESRAVPQKREAPEGAAPIPVPRVLVLGHDTPASVIVALDTKTVGKASPIPAAESAASPGPKNPASGANIAKLGNRVRALTSADDSMSPARPTGRHRAQSMAKNRLPTLSRQSTLVAANSSATFGEQQQGAGPTSPIPDSSLLATLDRLKSQASFGTAQSDSEVGEKGGAISTPPAAALLGGSPGVPEAGGFVDAPLLDGDAQADGTAGDGADSDSSSESNIDVQAPASPSREELTESTVTQEREADTDGEASPAEDTQDEIAAAGSTGPAEDDDDDEEEGKEVDIPDDSMATTTETAPDRSIEISAMAESNDAPKSPVVPPTPANTPALGPQPDASARNDKTGVFDTDLDTSDEDEDAPIEKLPEANVTTTNVAREAGDVDSDTSDDDSPSPDRYPAVPADGPTQEEEA